MTKKLLNPIHPSSVDRFCCLIGTWFPWFDIWIGFTFGLHLWGGLQDITVSLAIHGILLSVMLKGYGGIISWGQQFWSVTQGVVVDLIPKVANLVN